MARFLKRMTGLTLLGLIVAWFLSAPSYVDPAAFDGLTGDVAAGEQVFYAGGCSSCHSAPEAKGDAKYLLEGGRRFPTEFGTFVAPNISPDPAQGIGNWSVADLAGAMLNGVSPSGQHYYPAFPYSSYQHMTPQDIADLHAYLNTLPVSDRPNQRHKVSFPFDVRRTLGLWKTMFVKAGPVISLDSPTEEILRGQYLVEGPGHCGECHTSRNAVGGLEYGKWLAGGPNPDGPGTIPNITDHPSGLGGWSTEDIASYLKTGFRPDFDMASGAMADVIENLARLPDSDRAAIAAYLKAVPPLPAVK